MHPRELQPVSTWPAHLELDYVLRQGRTLPVRRCHQGPWLVQKALYPEGPGVCHHMLLHPPGGMAGGDALTLEVQVASGAAVLLTTPGAGKWYRSRGAVARQSLRFDVAAGAMLEWLPQESIVFDAALARVEQNVRLEAGATFVGWDVMCLGRTAAGETFRQGHYHSCTRIERDGQLLWLERGVLEGGSSLLQSPAGWNGAPVSATLVATGPGLDGDVLAACRALRPGNGTAAMTVLPGLWLIRYLGADAAVARAYLTSQWQLLRPALSGRNSCLPRIWAT